MRRRYGKFFAYVFAGSVIGCFNFTALTVLSLFLPKSSVSTLEMLLWLLVFAALTILMSWFLLKKVPEGERFGVWMRCFWLGFKISLKIMLFVTIILIGVAGSIDTNVSESDYYQPHWYDNRKKVRINGNEFNVSPSGGYIKMGSNWVKVNRAQNGDPYITHDGEKQWLE